MWNEYNNLRRVRTLKGVIQLLLKIRRCQNRTCERYKIKYRPEQEGSWALPQQEFGLDVIALVGALRYQEYRSIPQIHQHLGNQGVEVSERYSLQLLLLITGFIKPPRFLTTKRVLMQLKFNEVSKL
jgi:hypothetical protein